MTAFSIAIQTAAALLFLEAALGKLSDRAAFAGVVAGYRLLPAWAEPPVALLLGPVEIALAALLVSGLAAPFAGVAGAALLGVFALAMGINLVRGRSRIDCGCGRPGQPIAWSRVARNLVLAALLLAAQLAPAGATAGDWVLGLAAGAAIFCLDYVHGVLAATAPRRRQGAPA